MQGIPNSQTSPASEMPLRWLETYGDGLYAYAVRRVRRPEVAEDLVQDTLLAAVQAWDKFEQRSNVRTWLSSILRNKISDHLRDRYRHEPPESLDEDAIFDKTGHWRTPLSRWNGDPQRLAEMAEFRAVLDACLAKLPTRMSHLFLSRVNDGVTAVALCEELQITQDNAWMLLSRARLRLRECLTINWFSEKSVSHVHRS
jgi:RNA polymerase sigma-70 factor (ECF subfamily)